MIPFIITIDTEGDNVWARPRETTTENAAHLPRFQELTESYGLPVTYLTDYSMARSARFQQFAKGVLARRTGEIGMHLHAWDTPPISPLTDDDTQHLPYLVEYPDEVMRAKVAVLTELLEQVFETEVVSHRAGRWAFDERYARMLVDRGFLVDCSVTPHVSWCGSHGDPAGCGGTDYAQFDEQPWLVDLENIRRQGDSPLLEVPMTIVNRRPAWIRAPGQVLSDASPLFRRALNRFFPPAVWLRPNGQNEDALVALVEEATTHGRSHLEFMLHSSELMAGGSPTFKDDSSIERLYATLERLFSVVARNCRPMTLKDFRGWHLSRRGVGA